MIPDPVWEQLHRFAELFGGPGWLAGLCAVIVLAAFGSSWVMATCLAWAETEKNTIQPKEQ